MSFEGRVDSCQRVGDSSIMIKHVCEISMHIRKKTCLKSTKRILLSNLKGAPLASMVIHLISISLISLLNFISRISVGSY